MIKLRIRCEVLKVIAAMVNGTAEDVHKHLPHLTAKQVQKALYNLCEDDEVRKIGIRPRNDGDGKSWNVYRVREENEIQDKSNKKVYKKSGRKSFSQELQKGARYDNERNIHIVKFRERKLKLLKQLIHWVDGTDKDLLQGIIKDFENIK